MIWKLEYKKRDKVLFYDLRVGEHFVFYDEDKPVVYCKAGMIHYYSADCTKYEMKECKETLATVFRVKPTHLQDETVYFEIVD